MQSKHKILSPLLLITIAHTFNCRMLIGRFRFLETMGEGGESNPCYKPIYDEYIEAPKQHTVEIDGTVKERKTTKARKVSHNASLTIGPTNNFLGEELDDNGDEARPANTALSELFQPPE